MDNEILNILKQIQNDMSDVKQDIKGMKQDMGFVKVQQKEHTELLKSLEHTSEEHKAQMDNVTFAVARVEGEVKAIREDLNAVELITSKNWNEIVKLKAVK